LLTFQSVQHLCINGGKSYKRTTQTLYTLTVTVTPALPVVDFLHVSRPRS